MPQEPESVWDVLIKRGYPGRAGDPELAQMYPDTAARTAKVLGQAGLRVAFEDTREERRYEVHHSDDIVLPLLWFAQAVGPNIVASALYDLIKAFAPIGRSGDRLVPLHAEFYKDGTLKALDTQVRSSDALEAIRALVDRAEDSEG